MTISATNAPAQTHAAPGISYTAWSTRRNPIIARKTLNNGSEKHLLNRAALTFGK